MQGWGGMAEGYTGTQYTIFYNFSIKSKTIFLSFVFFSTTPVAYGSSEARDQI